ncbi:MAG: DNA (cytosine-5-)-methyltransferase, partial [Burkholderiales bacterium]|nr:DNA (cytosine-5-)-methyltransferase [Burkholderiales bacterium]
VLTFIDLFAGIGGFRLGFERAGFQCVFSVEINDHACEMYNANFGENPKGEITKLEAKSLPNFNVLCAGFPCQSFSISGKQAGFYDNTRGTLFFDICKILKIKQPQAFILENVQNLETHDKGNTLRVMLDSLQKLGYSVNYKVLNAKNFGIPQNRDRIIIVGNLNGRYFDFEQIANNPAKSMEHYLDYDGDFESLEDHEYSLIKEYKQQKASGLIFVGYRNKKIRTTGVRPSTEHLSRVHKQPNRIYSAKGMHPTISSQETSGRYWIFHDGIVRKLTINECFRFMGFANDYKKIGPKSKLYERIGNSVCVNLIEQVALAVKTQFFERTPNTMESPRQFLENIYNKAILPNNTTLSTILNTQQLEWVVKIVDNEESFKGVYTVLITSLTYKALNPKQDIRYHKVELTNGYSGRSFDTKYVTPFLKSKKFFGAMKESGWLTRSLEQVHPFNKNFPGKISNRDVKEAFLNILNDVEENLIDPEEYLLSIFKLSISIKNTKTVKLINPINSESKLNIDQVIKYLTNHFYYKYATRGASILPVVAIYSIY